MYESVLKNRAIFFNIEHSFPPKRLIIYITIKVKYILIKKSFFTLEVNSLGSNFDCFQCNEGEGALDLKLYFILYNNNIKQEII